MQLGDKKLIVQRASVGAKNAQNVSTILLMPKLSCLFTKISYIFNKYFKASMLGLEL